MNRSRLYLAAGLALTAVYFAFPSGGGAQTAIYTALGAGASAALLATRRPAWMLLGAGNAFFTVGDVLSVYDAGHLMDAFYLAGYPLLAAGLLWLMLASAHRNRLAALADAGIVLFAFAVFQWLFVLQSAVDSGWVAALYPVMDVVLLGGFAGFFVSPAWRTPAFGLLVGAVALLLAGDEIYLRTSYEAGVWIDATWMVAYVLWGTAALHRSRDELTRPRRQPALRVSFARIALLAVALLAVPAALLAQRLRGEPGDAYAIVGLGAAISLLVVARLTGILRALEGIRLRERQARSLAEDAQHQLAQQNQRLVEADRMKDEFVALISHDLRTPLTSIMGYVELALDDFEPGLDEERRGYLNVVSRSSERLLRLVDDLLFVARLQAGNLVLDPSRIDLCTVAAQSVEEARPRAEAKGLALSLLTAGGPVHVEADRGRIFQLLDNLISNAIKFTPEGGRVDVRVVAGTDGAVLEVSDTGVGLAQAEIDRVFERFFRTSTAVSKQVPGTGLGLFIARVIAEAHGGRISATARDSGGTTFRIELPARYTPQPNAGEELVA